MSFQFCISLNTSPPTVVFAVRTNPVYFHRTYPHHVLQAAETYSCCCNYSSKTSFQGCTDCVGSSTCHKQMIGTAYLLRRETMHSVDTRMRVDRDNIVLSNALLILHHEISDGSFGKDSISVHFVEGCEERRVWRSPSFLLSTTFSGSWLNKSKFEEAHIVESHVNRTLLRSERTTLVRD